MSGCLLISFLILFLNVLPSLSYSLNSYHMNRDDSSQSPSKQTNQHQSHFRSGELSFPLPLINDDEESDDISFQGGKSSESDPNSKQKSRHKLLAFLRIQGLIAPSSRDAEGYFKSPVDSAVVEDDPIRGDQSLETSKRSSFKPLTASQENYRRYLSRKIPTSNQSVNLLQDLKRTEGPSLSIVSPLDVLRQKMMLNFAQRRMKATEQQIQDNADYLRKIGKRSVLEQLDDGEEDFNQDSRILHRPRSAQSPRQTDSKNQDVTNGSNSV